MLEIQLNVMKLLTDICRVLVGTIFIISGLIKANDPLGFSYKLEEYFTVFKLTDSIADTSYTIRDMTSEEVEAMFAGKGKLSPVTYDGKPIQITDSTSRDEFFYVNEPVVSYSSVERKNFFNSACDFFHDYALWLSIFICIFEIVIGVAAILGYFMRFTTWMLMLMILFFTFLTFYSAYYNKVTDCGCFGDALKLEPWESFYKDIILLVLILPLFIRNRVIDGMQWTKSELGIVVGSILIGSVISLFVFDWYFPALFIFVTLSVRWSMEAFRQSPYKTRIITLVFSFIFSGAFTIYCLEHLPVKDYRPWKPGTSIPSKMIAEPEVAKVFMVYKDKKTGKETEYLAVNVVDGKTVNDFSWMSDTLFSEKNEFVRQRKEIIKPFKEAPIHDFTLDNTETGEPYAETFIYKPGYKFMLVAYDLKKTDINVQKEVNALAEAAQKEGIEFIGATSSKSEVEAFRHEHQNAFPYYINDATSLKTIIRSNPGLVLLKDTMVVGMWHHNDFPTIEEARKKMK